MMASLASRIGWARLRERTCKIDIECWPDCGHRTGQP
jgi:hypothetical protein